MRGLLLEELPDYDRQLGYESKAIKRRSRGVGEGKGKLWQPEARRGKHETGGLNVKTGEL